MLASRVGVVGAVLAALVLTAELGVAIRWQHRLTDVEVVQVRSTPTQPTARELRVLERRSHEIQTNHARFNDQLILPNRAGY